MILCLPLGVKRNSKLFRALLLFLASMMISASALGQVYKWVDERGVTHYGEQPPQGRKATAVPDRLASPAPGGPATPRTSPPKNPYTGEGAVPSEGDQHPGRSAAGESEGKLEREATRRQDQCNQQRELLARLKRSPPGFTRGEKGERVRVDNSETIARQEKLVVERCGS